MKTRTMEPRGGREGHGRHDLNETLKHRWGGSVKGEKNREGGDCRVCGS